MKWIQLTSGKNQQIFIDASRLVYISGAFTASQYGENRQIGLGKDFTAYILNSPENYRALKAAKIHVGEAEDWGQPRARTRGKAEPKAEPPAEKKAPSGKAPRLVKQKRVDGKLEPGTQEFTRVVLRLHEGLEKIGIAYTGEAMGTLIRDAVVADPNVTVDTIAELLRKQKAARSESKGDK